MATMDMLALLTHFPRQAYVEFESPQAATATKYVIEDSLVRVPQGQKQMTVTFYNPMQNPFKTLPKDAPTRKDQTRQGGQYNERPNYGNNYGNNNYGNNNYNNNNNNFGGNNFGGGYRGRGGYNRGGMNQNFNRNFNNQMGFNGPMGGGFNGGMGGGNFNSFNNRGHMSGMRGGGGMRGRGGNMMGMNPIGGMGMGMGGMPMGMMGNGMPSKLLNFNNYPTLHANMGPDFQGMGNFNPGGFGFQNQGGGPGGGGQGGPGDWGNPHGVKRPRPE